MAGLLGSMLVTPVAPTPAKARAGASPIDPQSPQSGHRPTHLGTAYRHDEQV
jgi:hypothetical protein